MRSLALALALLTPHVAAQVGSCFFLEYRQSQWVRDPWTFRWGTFAPESAFGMQFVPIGGTVGVLMFYSFDRYTYNPATIDPLHHAEWNPGCQTYPVDVAGVWWDDTFYAVPGDTLTIFGRQIDLAARPVGFELGNARVPTNGNNFGVIVRRAPVPRYDPPAPYLVAYLLVPARGWW